MHQPAQNRNERPEGLSEILARANERNLYLRLGLKSGATIEEIDAAESAIVRKFHPDRWHDTPFRGDCDRVVAMVTGAAATLRDPKKYELHCLRNGIGLDRYPVPQRSKAVSGAPSLEGQNFSTGLSVHILSEDPHLFHDVNTLVKAMDRGTQAGYLNTRQMFQEIVGNQYGYPELNLRCLRAAREPEPQARFKSLAIHAIHLTSELHSLSSLFEVFDRKPTEVRAAIQTKLQNKILREHITAKVVLDCLWVRANLPAHWELDILHRPVVNALAHYGSKRRKDGPVLAMIDALSADLTPEAVVERMFTCATKQVPAGTFGPSYSGGVAEDWMNCILQSIRLLPDRRSFFRSDVGKGILEHLLVYSHFGREVCEIESGWKHSESGEWQLVIPDLDPLYLKTGAEAICKFALSTNDGLGYVTRLARIAYNLNFSEESPFPQGHIPQGLGEHILGALVAAPFIPSLYQTGVEECEGYARLLGLPTDKLVAKMVARSIGFLEELGPSQEAQLTEFVRRNRNSLCRYRVFRAALEKKLPVERRGNQEIIENCLRDSAEAGLIP